MFSRPPLLFSFYIGDCEKTKTPRFLFAATLSGEFPGSAAAKKIFGVYRKTRGPFFKLPPTQRGCAGADARPAVLRNCGIRVHHFVTGEMLGLAKISARVLAGNWGYG